ncbi:ribokinase [Rouxiella silvae]|uniref:Ribokinase n=1 Tax=Rouxiella silvae TaxID=1646373 RepID=A0ABX3TX90_9GAMM|nr:ribokinase [Rouxiella silvae]KQN44375.1 carbohydrate kinase [Serratia sp. Leaf50]ORJ19826.1 ribokinase [Rouxiella silvae]
MSKLLVVGSLHYDIMVDAHHRPEKGETVIGTGCSYKFGGKGGNQAVSAAQAGANVGFLGAVGNDAHGQWLLDVLQKNHVDVQHVEIINGSVSGMSVAITDAEGDYGAVVISNANTKINAQQFSDSALWSGVGLLLLQNELPEEINLRAAVEAKKRGINVCINAAPAKVLSAELQKHIDMLVVNAVEARDMSGIAVNSLHQASEAAQVLNKTYPVVVVTAGELGVAYCNAEGQSQAIEAEKIELVSTHGAGDCFMGMLCASMLLGEPLDSSVVKANKAAALHVSRRA